MDMQTTAFAVLLLGPAVIIVLAWRFAKRRLFVVLVSWLIWVACCVWVIERIIVSEWTAFFPDLRPSNKSAFVLEPPPVARPLIKSR